MTDRHPLRLTPLPADEWDDRTRAALVSLIPAARANPGGAGNVLSTLVRHPDLTAAYLPFNAYLLNGSSLSPRIREVALLRVVYRRDCDYLWTHHLPIARRAGLTDGEIDDIRDGQARRREPIRRCWVRWTTSSIAAPSRRRCGPSLGRHFTEQQRMDLVFTIGGYCLLAMAVNTFGIEDEKL